MLTWREAEHLMKRARSNSKPIQGKHLRLARDGEVFVLSYRGNDIVRIHRDGSYEVTDAGWPTPTTRTKLKEYSPIRWLYLSGGTLYFERGRYSLSSGWTRLVPSDGEGYSVVNAGAPDPAEVRRWTRRYCEKYARIAGAFAASKGALMASEGMEIKVSNLAKNVLTGTVDDTIIAFAIGTKKANKWPTSELALRTSKVVASALRKCDLSGFVARHVVVNGLPVE